MKVRMLEDSSCFIAGRIYKADYVPKDWPTDSIMAWDNNGIGRFIGHRDRHYGDYGPWCEVM